MTAAVETETVREIIRRHVDIQILEMGETDAFEITRSILREVGTDVYQLAWICQQILPSMVSDVVRNIKHRSGEPSVKTVEQQVDLPDDIGDLLDAGDEDEPDAVPPIVPPIPIQPRSLSARGLSVSSKFGSDWYHKLMQEQFSKPGGKRQTMALGDMRKVELVHNIEERRRVASGALTWADQLEGMAGALERYNKTHVRDLSPAVVANVMQRAL